MKESNLLCIQIFLISLALLLVFNISFAQAPDTLWTRTYGGTNMDIGYSTQQTSDGGYIVAGYTQSFGGGDDAYLIKTDSIGDTLWTKTYRRVLGAIAYCVQQTTDNSYILVGSTMLNEGDILLIKTDSIGDTLWIRTYGGYISTEGGREVQQTADGNYIILGNGWDDYLNTSYIWLFKTDSLGDVIWSKFYYGAGCAEGYSIQTTPDSGYILTGCTCPSPAECGDVYIIKTDSVGDTIWTKTYGGEDADWAQSVRMTIDGGYAIAANTQSFGGTWLMKTNSNGDTLWTKIYQSYKAYSLQQVVDHGYIITGCMSNGDFCLFKTDSIGELLWTLDIDSIHGEGYSVQQTTDGGYIVGGWTTSVGAGGRDLYLIKTGPDTLSVDELKITFIRNNSSATIFSGPLLLPEGKKCKVYDVTGRSVDPDKIKPGIYFIETDGQITSKVIKVR